MLLGPQTSACLPSQSRHAHRFLFLVNSLLFQDGTVVIWNQEWNSTNWIKRVLPKFPDVVWRVSWSVTGNILAVSGGDNKVTLWKESLDNEWKCISQLDEEGETTSNI